VAGTPRWSPDGRRIAFYRRNFYESDASLWTVRPDGSDPTRICCDGVSVGISDWSPDGRTIVFQDDFGSNRGYYRVNADGSGLVKLFSPARELQAEEPVWAPDGTRLVLAQSDNGLYGGHSLFTSRPDGSDLARVTGPHPPSPGDREPSWQPIPAPRSSDFKNANQFCKSEQAFWGDRFASRYGGGANAFGKCVSQGN
jgi:Tol biopolymer transport system component